jgi:hypothetical protein
MIHILLKLFYMYLYTLYTYNVKYNITAVKNSNLNV